MDGRVTRHGQAARLLGALAALDREIEPRDAEEALTLRTTLIEQLGGPRFEQEERLGRSLPLEEAIALALADDGVAG